MGSCDFRLAKKTKKRTKIPERYICIQTSSMTPETHKFGKHPGAYRAGRGGLLLSLSAKLAYCFVPFAYMFMNGHSLSLLSLVGCLLRERVSWDSMFGC
jgi:hypothetical protein